MSDTKPLPASEFRRIDDKLYFYAMAVLNKGDRGAWGDEECALFGFCREYEAARAASPVTLEEALVREMHEADEAISDAGSPRPDELTKRWNTVAAQLKRHARRLAGEGGA